MKGGGRMEPHVTINSSVYGKLNVDPDSIFKFPKGLVGMAKVKEFGRIGLENTPFSILHAVAEQISFVLIPAPQVTKNYQFEIDDETIELLGITKPEDVEVWLIVNIIDDQLYVNLKAPVLLVPRSRIGCQYVILNQDLPIRQPLYREESLSC
jgi:flagellar assembly factor FliW